MNYSEIRNLIDINNISNDTTNINKLNEKMDFIIREIKLLNILTNKLVQENNKMFFSQIDEIEIDDMDEIFYSHFD